MKNRNNLFKVALVALAFVLVPVASAVPRPDGGPTPIWSNARRAANSEAEGQAGKPGVILPVVSINFAPVGLTLGQTARLNLLNMDIANGITVIWRFNDPKGATLAQSSTTLGVGKIVSVDFRRQSDTLPGDPPELLRAEVQVQLDIITPGVPSDSLRRSLEVFDNNSGATTVFMDGGGS